MVSGFSFCGVDVSDIGLEYAPDNANTYVHRPAKFKVHEEMFDQHDGGFYFGYTRLPKDFTQRCFYEQTNVKSGLMPKIYHQFEIGKTGKLVFKQYPWCYYIATVVDVDTTQMFNYQNGCVVIKMKAYYPFAQSDENKLNAASSDYISMRDNTAFLDEAIPSPSIECAKENTQVNQTSIILHNPGTEDATVAIEIAGVASGVTIANKTTGQACRIINLTKEQTTNAGKYVVVDSLTGKTILTNGVSSEQAFRYHDNGFQKVAPSYPVLRDVAVRYEKGSNILFSEELLSKDNIGKYLYVDGLWRKIVNVVGDEITINSNCETTGTIKTNVVLMNEITITPDSSMELTKLNFIYKPTFS